MGWYVHLHVCFAANGNEGIARLACHHLESLGADADEASWFLDDLSKRVDENPGPKGGLSLWGIVGNHTDVARFVEVLRPFWADLLSGRIDDGPCDHQRILVFYEEEQSEAANAIEIGWDDETSESRQLVVTSYARLPFAWRQY
jgi:hypothetical protein